MFSDLRAKLDEVLNTASDTPFYNNSVNQALLTYQNELNEGLKSALAEYELGSGYTT